MARMLLLVVFGVFGVIGVCVCVCGVCDTSSGAAVEQRPKLGLSKVKEACSLWEVQVCSNWGDGRMFIGVLLHQHDESGQPTLERSSGVPAHLQTGLLSSPRTRCVGNAKCNLSQGSSLPYLLPFWWWMALHLRFHGTSASSLAHALSADVAVADSGLILLVFVCLVRSGVHHVAPRLQFLSYWVLPSPQAATRGSIPFCAPNGCPVASSSPPSVPPVTMFIVHSPRSFLSWKPRGRLLPLLQPFFATPI